MTEQLISHAIYSKIESSMAFSSDNATYLGTLGAARRGWTELRLVNKSMSTVVMIACQPAGAKR
jgi:hypothetical protein